ncbi:hypothetical protein VE03_00409 [Pseudogymnoascus sp. 23342-1-I1]|nr:hypothetical protein VE03_00409 [Pseudogymnoascus sp. 23342-1-I1]
MGGHKLKRASASGSILLSSSPRDPNSCPFEDFLQYLNASLSRNVFLRLSESIIKKMKATLARLRQNDQKVTSDIVERIVSAIDAFQEACSELHPSAFVAIVRILIHAEDSQFRDRGLYLLAEFLHNGNKRQEATGTDEIQKSLSDVSKDCLELIFVTFCDKSESYKTRRWAGLLVLELTSHSEDNVQLIGFMPEDKRRKLGSQILYEENEILRTISGRILTTLTDSDILQKELLFPEQTEKDLIAQYPEQAPSASQWDKRFSSYLDNIWGRISGTENTGSIDFAQNLVTIPEYMNTKTISIYHRSIYVVFSDAVYIYVHSESKGFDTAIDIPYHLISDIRVEPTPLDQSVGVKPPADLILHIKCTAGDQAYVNSSSADISIVQLTFKDATIATDIGKAVRQCRAKLNCETGGQDTSGHNKGVPHGSEASFTKVSQSGNGLVLDGNYPDTNAKAAEARVNSDIHAIEHATESSFHESFDDSFVGVVMASKNISVPVRVKTQPAKKTHNTTDADGGIYDASPKTQDRRPRSLIATAPANNSLGSQKRVPPIPNTELSSDEQVEAGNVPLHNAPTNMDTRTEDYDVSGMTISTSDEFGISSPHIHQSPSVALPGNPADDALPPTQHDESIDELSRMPPVILRPKKKQALKSKKPLDLPKKAGENGNTSSRSTKQQDKVSERNNPLAKCDVIGETQDNTGDKDTAVEKVSKHHSEKGKRSWSIEPDSPKLPALPLKKPVETSREAFKKRKSEMDPPGRILLRNRLNASPVEATSNDFADSTHGKSDVRPGPSNRTHKPPSTKLAKTEQVDAKGDSATAAVAVTKSKKGQKKPLLRPKAALKTKDSVSNDINMPHADTGGQHVESDTLNPLQQHENFFEEALHDDELPIMDDEPPFTPEPPLSAVTKIASKMADIFGFVGERSEPKRKLREYGKKAQKPIREPQKQSKPKAKVSLKGKEKEVVAPLPEADALLEADALTEEPEQKRSPITTGKSLATTPKKEEIETIYISSDDESEDLEDLMRHQPQAIAQSAMVKLDEKTTSATAVKTESSIPPLLEAPSDLLSEDHSTPGMIELDKKTMSATSVKTESSTPALLEPPSELSPEDQSTLAMTQLPRTTVPAPVGPTKLRNTVDAAYLVDDHLARKTPIVAFGINGPKNQGVTSALKPKPVERSISKTDMAKLVNAVALAPPRKRPSPEAVPHFEAPLPKRVKKVEVAANTVVNDDACNDDIPNMRSHRLNPSSPFAPQQDSLLCSSQSRVDENGSPRARPTIIEETAKVARIRRKTLSISQKMPHISQNKDTAIEKGPFDEGDGDICLAFDDEPTVVQDFGDPSPKQKLQILGREKGATVYPRYLLSRPATTGKNTEVIPETDHASTVSSMNPFEESKPRQLSNFAKRLKGEQPVKSKVTITTESQPQPFLKATNALPRKRAFVFEPGVTVADPEKTLVDAENQYTWRRARSVSLGSSVSSSDTVDDKASVAATEEEELTPEMAWRKTLQPPYRNLTDTLICMVHTLVGDLVDKETAVDGIVDEYTRNGTRQVEELERKASANRRELESQFSNTLQKVTRSFQQTRDVTIALNSEWENLDDLEAQWRKRQHELQDFMNDRIKCAPVAPKKRSSIRAKVSRAGSGMMTRPANYQPSESFGAGVSDDFLNTKKDKRTIKHSAFVNRIEKANTKTLKRRRPSKKLVATLESLADALPDFDDDGNGGERIVGDAKIKHRSLKSRPGATKRREKLEKMERERFGKNMAQLSATTETAPALEGQPHAAAAAATSNKWAALRGFISQTLEQKPEFVKS